MEKGKTTYESILKHPFIQEMAAGTLAEERFALAAMLPCIWIYNRVGLYILRIAKLEGNDFQVSGRALAQ